MVIASWLGANCSGLIRPYHYELQFRNQIHKRSRFSNNNACLLASSKISRVRTQSFLPKPSRPLLVVSAASNQRQLNFDDGSPKKPLWLSLIEDIIWDIRSLLVFLVEQPGQLKYIEWPSFKNTIKTATLALVLVAILIVSLASVDSSLCFLLAVMLRRPR